MACIFGHKWDGCKCPKCGRTRDEQHDWNKCKCSRCGKTRDEQHDWDLCFGRCKCCGKTQAEQHDWNGCKCSSCGMTRNQRHAYESIAGNCQEKCSVCGKSNYTHNWQNGSCVKCGKTLPGLLDKVIEAGLLGWASEALEIQQADEKGLQVCIDYILENIKNNQNEDDALIVCNALSMFCEKNYFSALRPQYRKGVLLIYDTARQRGKNRIATQAHDKFVQSMGGSPCPYYENKKCIAGGHDYSCSWQQPSNYGGCNVYQVNRL